ncbi:YolD-like family protein [Bacillus altitudinis]|uniref:Y-family DNA polymerase n=1 Tax=Bacillus TaxID=1386 RepID=UPI001D9A678C|nr:YolD-like family protein [Bacillus altitudinis]MBY0185952.1 YolD-like family protein [Bacillus aerophilus]MCW4357536.1 YolD-like family protein [Bacillus altitudinis]MCY7581904.1 YolD-like family protein [Bacillus altitudinis]MCY7596719.1 YolD-like family protein [Bacillus altitudinis]
MLRDRGTIKWTAMMLPEHVARLKHDLAESKKIDKPIIDEQQAEEFEATIAYAMSINKPLIFSIYESGVVNQLKGFSQYINYEKKMLHIKDMSDMMGLDPLECYWAVVGNTERQGSVVLAASPKLKQDFKIKTGSRLFEIPDDPRIHIVNPKMDTFINVSTKITQLFYRYVPECDVHTYSIDESFLKVDGVMRMWNSVEEIAEHIQDAIMRKFDLSCTIGIGDNMLISKLALDLESKKAPNGIVRWRYEDIPERLWPVRPISKMWGIGRRMEQNLNRIGKSQILLRDYTTKEEIKAVILEICEEVAKRTRDHNKVGRTISLGIGYSKEEYGGGFHRSKTVENPTHITMDIYNTCIDLFNTFYQHKTVRSVSVTLSKIEEDSNQQLTLFDESGLEKKRQLGYVMDGIGNEYGSKSLLRVVSYTKGGTALYRAGLTGGHKS